MFNPDFYPTPPELIDRMLDGLDLQGKVVLEPSAGKGDIVDVLIARGATVIVCENDPNLVNIVSKKAKLIERDFTQVKPHQISHVDYIIMNPPFSADEHHINHAYDIAAPGTKIVALCNWNTLDKSEVSKFRRKLLLRVNATGTMERIEKGFGKAERKTQVDIGLITLSIAGQREYTDFSEFFSDQDDELEAQVSGLMQYNPVRDVVQRYVNALKLYDEVLAAAVKMNALTKDMRGQDLTFIVEEKGVPVARETFAKELQKKSWNWIFDKVGLRKYITNALKDELNRNIEQMKELKFTMRNVYSVLQMVVGTHHDRMEKALITAFEDITKRSHKNRLGIPGWKTNSDYMINKKIIIDYISDQSRWNVGKSTVEIDTGAHGYSSIDDMHKALCYMMGRDYDKMPSLYQSTLDGWKIFDAHGGYLGRKTQEWEVERFIKDQESQGNYGLTTIKTDRAIYGEPFDWGFFTCVAYKKGTIHFTFTDEEVWARFNQFVAKYKGFPLPENVQKKATRKRKQAA